MEIHNYFKGVFVLASCYGKQSWRVSINLFAPDSRLLKQMIQSDSGKNRKIRNTTILH